MKKNAFFLVLMSFFFVTVNSQESELLSNKNGVPVLPAAGDIGFGISANPFFNYAGNLFSSSGTNQLNLALPDAIYVKYFLDSKSALRIKLNLYRSSSNRESIIPDDLDADLNVTDHTNTLYSYMDLGIGYEKRRGKNRLQLFYGGEISLSTSRNTREFEYGNAFSIDNPQPNTTYDFTYGNYGQVSNRPLEDSQNNGLGIGLRVFTGLEYFLLPKISVGGEFGLGYTQYFGGKNVETYEGWDWGMNEIETTTNEVSLTRSTTASDISSGRIFLLFYF